MDKKTSSVMYLTESVKNIMRKNAYIHVFSGIKTLKEADISFLPYESNVCVHSCVVRILLSGCVYINTIDRIFSNISNFG